MNKHYQEHDDDVLDLWLDLDRMSIAAWATEVAAGGSPEPSAIQNPDEGLPDDEPLPLCLCGSHVCACPTTSEPVHIRIGPMIPLSSNPVAAVPCPRSCGCSCRVQEICDAARLKATHFVIMSAIRQLQGNTPYGAMPSELQERVLQMIDISEAEYMLGVRWLLEEAYIMSPLDDGRLMLVK